MNIPNKMLIGGEWVGSKEQMEVINPYDGRSLGKVLEQVARMWIRQLEVPWEPFRLWLNCLRTSALSY